jgi:hypothetical protein
MTAALGVRDSRRRPVITWLEAGHVTAESLNPTYRYCDTECVARNSVFARKEDAAARVCSIFVSLALAQLVISQFRARRSANATRRLLRVDRGRKASGITAAMTRATKRERERERESEQFGDGAR